MKHLLTWVCLFGFLATLVGQAAAEDKKPEKKKPDLKANFAKLDADKDGSLTEAEFLGKRTGEKAEMGKKQFARLDKNKDGKLSEEEFTNRAKKAPKKKDE